MSFNHRQQDPEYRKRNLARLEEHHESVRAAGSRTQQHFREKQDINRIVRDFAQTGRWDHVMNENPQYGDFSGARHLQEALNLTRSAETDFMRLPASVRQAASNDVVEYLEMLATPEGAQELCNAGLPIDGLTPEPAPGQSQAPEAPPAERPRREDVASQNVPVPVSSGGESPSVDPAE